MTHWSVEGVESGLDGFALGPVDLALAPGRVVAVLGNSGAGKTTLLRTLAGFLDVRAGRILRDGEEITYLPPEDRRLGYVPQGLGLFPHRTVERNVSYPFEMRAVLDWRSRTETLLRRFDLLRLAHRRPAQLSGGELQRVALARALAAEPELVLWDEPWQALDVEARHALDLVFEELRAESSAPVVVVTHDPALAFSVADSFLVLRKGVPRPLADAAALIERPGDAFTARFVGYENVFDRTALAGAAPGSFGAWLAAQAGPDGVAFPRVDAAAGPAPPNGWTGTVRSARPTPDGLLLRLAVDRLDVAARLRAPLAGPAPGAGATLAFAVAPTTVHPLG